MPPSTQDIVANHNVVGTGDQQIGSDSLQFITLIRLTPFSILSLSGNKKVTPEELLAAMCACRNQIACKENETFDLVLI